MANYYAIDDQISLPELSDDDEYSLPMNEIHVSEQDSVSDVGGGSFVATTSVEDQLLNELLGEVGRAKEEAQTYSYHPQKTAVSDGTSVTYESGSDGDVQLGRELTIRPSRDDGEEEESHEQESCSSESSDATQTLLDRAHERIAMQRLHEEIERLHEVVEQKNEEIKKLAGQLRQAVETKCDLVIAHTELERHHAFNLACKKKDVTALKEENRTLQEKRTEAELTLLNELVQLTDAMKEAEKAHQQELDDWERLHRNEMLEKDYQIAQLSEELRKLSGLRHVPHRSGLEVLFGMG
ncbi:hypothetical protein FisN_14Hh149 [Fistulifera solaris]|jgi:hypothetical protein|uniref:Uncharacterized protein n=1 Tax=Fistulifera solaris TaxID=1519565 RepID=A0A1Z5K8F9_FISSO|nr:hypothetical protein FisN_14Hh149 [Fistulifera solaris]|eukprot:GAX22527.1 hypothetical protein FisN_14Hh149 [Fistulifera solaris]